MRAVDFFVQKFLSKPPSDDALWAALTAPRNSYSDGRPRGTVLAIDMQASMLPESEALHGHEPGFHARQAGFITNHNQVFDGLGGFVRDAHVFLVTARDEPDIETRRLHDHLNAAAQAMGYTLHPVTYDDAALSIRPDERGGQVLSPLNPRALAPGAKILLKNTKDLFLASGSPALTRDWHENKIDTVLITGLFAEDCVDQSMGGLTEHHFDLRMIVDPELIAHRDFTTPGPGWIYAQSGLGHPRLMITEPGQVGRVLRKSTPR